MENAVLSFTIILSFIGIGISIASSVFAIVYLVKISKLQSIQSSILKKMGVLDNIKCSLISTCILFENDKSISGKEAVNVVCNYFKCDEWKAISLIKNNDDCLKLIDWTKIGAKE